MNQRIRKLFENTELTRYIAEQARRHFSHPEDQDDARQDAWEKIINTPGACFPKECEKIAYRAIHAKYERARMSRKKSPPGQICT